MPVARIDSGNLTPKGPPSSGFAGSSSSPHLSFASSAVMPRSVLTLSGTVAARIRCPLSRSARHRASTSSPSGVPTISSASSMTRTAWLVSARTACRALAASAPVAVSGRRTDAGAMAPVRVEGRGVIKTRGCPAWASERA